MYVKIKVSHLIIAVGLLVSLWWGGVALAGDPDSSGGPASTNAYSLEDLYQRLNSGAAGSQSTFTEPSSGPGTGTMHTIDQIMAVAPAVDDTNGATPADVTGGKSFWSLTTTGWGQKTGTGVLGITPAPVPKTGQTTSYATGDDGALQRGVAWPNPRFITTTTGIVTDTLTGLIWLQDANCLANHYPGFDNDYITGDGRVTWQHALDFVAGINNGTYPNCRAGFTDWRLPNIRELHSLIDFSQYGPALPSDHPFTDAQAYDYWSSSTSASNASSAWNVDVYYGFVYNSIKASNSMYVWPVRGGQ